MNRLQAYTKLNNSFQKKYIFNFGSEGGFYSEFNNMIFGMIYCLKYRYKFVMYSHNSKFKIAKGWNDFFEPFCEETGASYFHRKFNRRITARSLKFKHYPAWYLFKLFNQSTLLSYQLFNSFFDADFEKEQFDFPELGLKGNLRDVSRGIVEMIYRFNTETKAAVMDIIASIALPKQYIAVNIRRGDKDTEFNFVPLSAYMDKAGELSALRDAFILTDDYTVIEELKKEYPQYRYYTLVQNDERGYVHGDFIKTAIEEKKANLVKLFASLEVMAGANLSIGTFTTNPGIFLGMYMPEEKKFVSVQRQSWYQFDQDDVKNYIVK